MSGIRTSGIRLAGAAAAVALAALSLTACGDGGTGARAANTGPGTAGSTTPASAPAASAPSASPSAADPASSEAPGSSGHAESGGSKPTPRHTTAAKAPASSGRAVTCEGSNTRTVAAPLNRPVNHMLLTVTNTGSTTCYLYNYPALQFTGAQAVPPAIDGSHPQAVVTLAPGESGYASVNLSSADGSGTDGYTAKTLAVYFSGRSGTGSVGAAAHPPLPAKGLYVDSTLQTTYWQQSMDDALNW